MKKQVLLIASVCAMSTLNAQSFPNGGFETWTTQMTYEDPQYWTSMNMLSMFGADETAVKTTDAHSGTYAVKLVTSTSDMDGDGVMDPIPGVLMLGSSSFSTGSGTMGYPFAHRPDSLVGWYKLVSPDNTPFVIEFSSTKWDAGSGSADMIGAAYYEGQASSGYQRFSVPISYLSNGIPDSIQASIGTSLDGSITNELYLDDLGFVYNTTAGIQEQHAQVRLFPNPVTTNLHIQSDLPIQQIFVKDLQGKQVFGLQGSVENLETGELTPGVYFCELYFSNGSSERLKFMKQ